MALVDLPLKGSFTILDASGSTSEMEVGLQPATTLAVARTAMTALVAELNDASAGIVQSYNITATTIETEPAAPETRSRVEKRGNLQFRTAAGKIARVTIPAINGAVVTEEGRLDEDAAELAPVIARLRAAPFSDSNGALMSTLVKAYESYKTSTRSQLPAKRTPDADTTAEAD